MDDPPKAHGFRRHGPGPFSWATERTPGATSVLFLAGRVGRLTELLTQRVLRTHHLDSSQLAVLVVLASAGSEGSMSPGALAGLLAQTRSGITRTVKRLERDRLVERGPDPSDGRAILLSLTEAGEARMAGALDDLLEQFEARVDTAAPVDLLDVARTLQELDGLFEQLPAPVIRSTPVVVSEHNSVATTPTAGEAVRRMRAELGISQRVLAASVGVGAPHLSRIERGEEQPSEGLLVRIAEALDLDADELVLRAGLVPAWMASALASDPTRAIRTLRTWTPPADR